MCLCACAQKPAYRAPVDDINRAAPKMSGAHVVQEGETFYTLAWRYNRDFNELARVNGLKPPYQLTVGQTIQLGRATAPTPAPATVAKAPKPIYTQPQAAPAVAAPPTPAPSVVATRSLGGLQWQWPAQGKIIGNFSTQKAQKGIDIGGQNGQPVMTAAPGVVVYSGSGLRGYGQMVIIKHNDQFLSAYAHNSRLLVKEGDTVKAQMKIAEMGQTDTESVRLHFEIRKNGQPVDPMLYLPKKG
jgi:lipoprotein NlpD